MDTNNQTLPPYIKFQFPNNSKGILTTQTLSILKIHTLLCNKIKSNRSNLLIAKSPGTPFYFIHSPHLYHLTPCTYNNTRISTIDQLKPTLKLSIQTLKEIRNQLLYH